MFCLSSKFLFFFFTDTATTEIYTLSLHDALPILLANSAFEQRSILQPGETDPHVVAHCLESVGAYSGVTRRDRKSTRLNSSHANISYAVFCLKKKKKKNDEIYIIHDLI